MADFEAHANQTIVDKYRMLKTLKLQMTNIKRDFNECVLKLQNDKLRKCTILCGKIDELDRIYRKLYCKNDKRIEVKEHTEKVIQFDGKTFKVESSSSHERHLMLFHLMARFRISRNFS